MENRQVKSRQKNVQNSFVSALFVNYLKPSIYVNSVKNIDLDVLKKQGIKLIICDLDNTLVPHFTKFPTKVAIDFVKDIKKHMFDFIIVSNNTSKRVSFFAEKLGLESAISGAKKPFPFEIRKAIKRYNIQPSEVVIIGDMIITDILVANILKTESILVRPVLEPKYAWSRSLHWMETYVFNRLDKQNLIVKSDPTFKTYYNKDYELL